MALSEGRLVTCDREYLKRAIVDPDADIVSDYSNGVMSGAMPGKPLSAAEFEALVVYLESLSE